MLLGVLGAERNLEAGLLHFLTAPAFLGIGAHHHFVEQSQLLILNLRDVEAALLTRLLPPERGLLLRARLHPEALEPFFLARIIVFAKWVWLLLILLGALQLQCCLPLKELALHLLRLSFLQVERGFQAL